MAKIEGEITANIGPFRKALHQATESAKEWAEKMNEVGAEASKGLTGGLDLGKALKIGGMAYLAGAIVEKLKDVVKEALATFSEGEQATLKLKYNVAPGEFAEDKEFAEKHAGKGLGTKEDVMDETSMLSQMGIKMSAEIADAVKTGVTETMKVNGKDVDVTVLPSDNKPVPIQPKSGEAVLGDLRDFSVKTGASVKDMLETLQKYSVGETGEKEEAGTKLLKQMPALMAPIKDVIASDAAKYKATYLDHGGGTKEQQDQYKTLSRMKPADWMKEAPTDGNDKFQQILAMIHTAAPQGAGDAKANTLQGHADALAAQFVELNDAIGEALAPGIEKLMDAFADALPGMTKQLTAVTSEMEGFAIPVLKGFTAAVADALKTESAALAKAGKSEMEHWEDLHAHHQMSDSGNIISSAYKGQEGGTIGDLLTDRWQMMVFKGLGMKLPDFGSQDVANFRMTDQGMNPGKLDDHQTAIDANTVALVANTAATLQSPGDIQ
jgi:hypothetical protein